MATCRAHPRRGAGVHVAMAALEPSTRVAVAFSAQALADAANLFGAHQSAALYTTAYVLLLPYSLLRWGAGREAVIGLVIIVVVVPSVSPPIPLVVSAKRWVRRRSCCSPPR